MCIEFVVRPLNRGLIQKETELCIITLPLIFTNDIIVETGRSLFPAKESLVVAWFPGLHTQVPFSS